MCNDKGTAGVLLVIQIHIIHVINSCPHSFTFQNNYFKQVIHTLFWGGLFWRWLWCWSCVFTTLCCWFTTLWRTLKHTQTQQIYSRCSEIAVSCFPVLIITSPNHWLLLVIFSGNSAHTHQHSFGHVLAKNKLGSFFCVVGSIHRAKKQNRLRLRQLLKLYDWTRVKQNNSRNKPSNRGKENKNCGNLEVPIYCRK